MIFYIPLLHVIIFSINTPIHDVFRMIEILDVKNLIKYFYFAQFLIMTALAPIQLVVGSVLGQSAGMIPQLMQEDSVIKIDIDVATWIGKSDLIN